MSGGAPANRTASNSSGHATTAVVNATPNAFRDRSRGITVRDGPTFCWAAFHALKLSCCCTSEEADEEATEAAGAVGLLRFAPTAGSVYAPPE